jgi:ankyrin repeat protein
MSKDGLQQHFVDCHKGLDGQQIENLLDLAETTVADDRQTCPFCYSVGPFDKGFYNHVAFHQEQLATFAVPRNFANNEEADSGRAEGIRSAASLRSVALEFSDSDSGIRSANPSGLATLNSSDGDSSSFDSDDGVKKVDNSLLRAAKIGDEAALRALLENSAELEKKGTNSMTALVLAAENGHEAVVKLLLEKGAKRRSKLKSGRTPLGWAASGGHEEVVRLLLEADRFGVNSIDDEGMTPLGWAAKNGHETVVKLLLDKGAEQDLSNRYGMTPLGWAAKNGHEAVVKQLLDTESVDVNWKDVDGMRPLAWAAKNGYEVIVKLLLHIDSVDVNSKDKTTQAGGSANALHHASFGGYEDIVQMLLDRDANINAQGGKYDSALHAA